MIRLIIVKASLRITSIVALKDANFISPDPFAIIVETEEGREAEE